MTDTVDLLVIGGGLTGLAAAERARARGLSTLVLASAQGSLPFTSGALDLLGVYPTETKRFRKSPWEALGDLAEREPEHPYALLGLKRVRDAWLGFIQRLAGGPLAYHHQPEENALLVTSAGTLKPTYAVPRSMTGNLRAWQEREPTLIVGFDELTDFAAAQVVDNLADRWPGLRGAQLGITDLLERPMRLGVVRLAGELERPEMRQRLCERLAPLLGRSRFLGLPAVLGLHRAAEVFDDLEQRLGVTVFELPLLSPSVPGLRLAGVLEEELRAEGALLRRGHTAVELLQEDGAVSEVAVQAAETVYSVRPKAVVLASGRFLGGGMEASRAGVRVPLLDLELDPPADRDGWHMSSFLGAPGHPINRLGVSVDEALRPLSGAGEPLWQNLFVAGALLAGHDWVREKSGAGISVATGAAAADQAAELCGAAPAAARPGSTE